MLVINSESGQVGPTASQVSSVLREGAVDAALDGHDSMIAKTVQLSC